VLGLNALDGFGKFCLCIFYHMAFIQNTVKPVKTIQISNVVPDNFVGSDDNVISQHLREETGPLSCVSSVQYGPQIIRILLNFVIPMTCQSWRANDE